MSWNRTNWSQYVASLFWRMIFFTNAVDLFSIYKQDYGKPITTSRSRWYLRDGLTLAKHPTDRYRDIWKRCLSLLVIYLGIRHSIFIVMQVGIHSTLVRPFIKKFLKRLEIINPDPLGGTSSISVAVYCMLVCALAFIFLFSRKYGRTPMNAGPLRFMLDPDRELRRIDLVLDEELVRLNFEVTFQIQSPKSSNFDLLQKLVSTIESIKGTAKMYPGMYDEEGYKKIWNVFMVLIPFMFVGGISLLLHLFVLFLQNIKFYCYKSRIYIDCSIRDVYNTRHLIAVGEIVTSTFLTGSSLGLVLFGTVASIFGHLNSIHKLNEHLLDLRHTFGTSNINGRSLSLKDRVSLDVKALVTLIKFRTSNQELNHNMTLLSQLTAPLIICSWTGMIVVVLTGKFPGFTGTRYYRMSFLFFTWVIANAILVLCAYSHARSLDLEKLSNNVLGHIYCSYLLDMTSFKDDLVLELWRRLVFALGEKRHPVVTFGMNITYHQVLRLNFFIVSILSLIK